MPSVKYIRFRSDDLALRINEYAKANDLTISRAIEKIIGEFLDARDKRAARRKVIK